MLGTLIAFAAIGQQQTLPLEQQFDFWVGEWECTGRMLQDDEWIETVASNRIEKVLGGKVIQENFSMEGFNGKSWSVYDPARSVWRQTWVDDSGGYLSFIGGMDGDRMILTMVPDPANPSGPLNRMVFADITKDSLTWRWEKPGEDGNYELVWQLNYRRKN